MREPCVSPPVHVGANVMLFRVLRWSWRIMHCQRSVLGKEDKNQRGRGCYGSIRLLENAPCTVGPVKSPCEENDGKVAKSQQRREPAAGLCSQTAGAPPPRAVCSLPMIEVLRCIWGSKARQAGQGCDSKMLVAFRWVVFRALLLPPAGISVAGRVHRSSDVCSWRVQILRAKAEPVERGACQVKSRPRCIGA